ncbi:MAG: SUMF1/EgtB/PvdO family nonheme iron enzyme, partial [Chloroflexi bacterium]|nr:SUMF1/EgtB/PvdO family nonheme iron enzyme [Chloroflexota bacterium]
MKSMHFGFTILLVLFVMLAACAPVGTAAPDAKTTSTPISLVTASSTADEYSYVDQTLLLRVPAGPFMMGHGGQDDPRHIVNLDEYWIYQTKVTNQQYAWCVALGQCSEPDSADASGYGDPQRAAEPVVGVTWEQAAAYCKFVNTKLPTEAQWEKAARGPNGNTYPWGEAQPSNDLLNFNNTLGFTTDVTNYSAGQSFYHALDMAGNAFEWVADWYDPNYYAASPASNPPGPDAGTLRSVRGSSFKSIPDEIPSARRFFQTPTAHKPDLGFRCVVTDPQLAAPLCVTSSLEFPPGQQPTPLPPYQCPTTPVNMGWAGCGNNDTTLEYVNTTPNQKLIVPAGVNCNLVTVKGDGSKSYVCGGASDATYVFDFIETCSPPAPPPSGNQPQCNPGYQYDPGTFTCIFKGSPQGNQCPQGLGYDAAQSCCALPTGVSYPLCPAG